MGVTILQCKQCKRLFQSFGSSFCPDCVQKLEENFELVRKYIYDNPHANVVEISQETDVPERDILYFLKEGRLSIAEGDGMLLCENCGRSIITGRYCDHCKKIFEKELSAVYVGPEKKKQDRASGLGKMHIDLNDR